MHKTYIRDTSRDKNARDSIKNLATSANGNVVALTTPEGFPDLNLIYKSRDSLISSRDYKYWSDISFYRLRISLRNTNNVTSIMYYQLRNSYYIIPIVKWLLRNYDYYVMLTYT